jgi:hypothetical protein
MGLNMKVNGRMICNMDMVLKHGLMDLDMKAITLKGKKMELEVISGMMDHNTQVIGLRIK